MATELISIRKSYLAADMDMLDGLERPQIVLKGIDFCDLISNGTSVHPRHGFGHSGVDAEAVQGSQMQSA